MDSTRQSRGETDDATVHDLADHAERKDTPAREEGGQEDRGEEDVGTEAEPQRLEDH